MYILYTYIYIVIGEVLNSWNAGHWVSRSSSPYFHGSNNIKQPYLSPLVHHFFMIFFAAC